MATLSPSSCPMPPGCVVSACSSLPCQTVEPNTSPGPSLVAGVKLCCPVNWGRGWAELGECRPGQELQSCRLVGWEGGPGGPADAHVSHFWLPRPVQVPLRGPQAAAAISQHRWRARGGLPSQQSPRAAANASQLLPALGSQADASGSPSSAERSSPWSRHSCAACWLRRLRSRSRLFPELTALGLEAPLGPMPCTARAGRRHAASKPCTSLGCGLGTARGQAQGCAHVTSGPGC